VVAEVKREEIPPERRGRLLGLGMPDSLDVFERLSLLLPELPGLATLAIGQRHHPGLAARAGGHRDRAARTPDEIRGVGADHHQSTAHPTSTPASRRLLRTVIVCTSDSEKPAASNRSANRARPSSTGGLAEVGGEQVVPYARRADAVENMLPLHLAPCGVVKQRPAVSERDLIADREVLRRKLRMGDHDVRHAGGERRVGDGEDLLAGEVAGG
jgi:hypothetical protein